MTKHLLRVCIIVLAIGAFAGVSATAAFAYPSEGSKGGSCTSCHGAESSTQASNTIGARVGDGSEAGVDVGTRKGPHGGYTSGTQKCISCHTIHDAPSNYALLPQPTIVATCDTCHDGTGGSGVYGVIKARTGVDPGAQHRVEVATGAGGKKMVVPGGDPATGGSIETSFTGTNGSLTCTDCHSPHNNDTVKPFVGDRRRSTSDAATFKTPTNRLLRQKVTSSTTTSTEYGSDWCEECHRGRHGQTSIGNHPVAYQADGYYYRKVERLSAYGSTTRSATATDLGGSNLGYVMSDPRGSQPAPICQQCHEDSRNIGDEVQYTVSNAESFTVSPDGTTATSNPRFQNFPHETENPGFLVEQYDDLCLNCHTAPN